MHMEISDIIDVQDFVLTEARLGGEPLLPTGAGTYEEHERLVLVAAVKPPVAINPKRREFFGLGAMPSAISSKSATLIQQIRPQPIM